MTQKQLLVIGFTFLLGGFISSMFYMDLTAILCLAIGAYFGFVKEPSQ